MLSRRWLNELYLIDCLSTWILWVTNSVLNQNWELMCIYSLKEIIGSYSKLNGCVFSCFLDASKALDRVKHYVIY